MIFFWNRYELPAVLSGQVSRASPRMAIFTNQGFIGPESLSQNSTLTLDRDQSEQRTTSMQRIDMTSYPSMSSLGRMSSPLPPNIIGQDQDGYWIFMNGEVRIFMIFHLESMLNILCSPLMLRLTLGHCHPGGIVSVEIIYWILVVKIKYVKL